MDRDSDGDSYRDLDALSPARAGYGDAGDAREAVRAHRRHWDGDAVEYLAAHREDLGDTELSWGPERLLERDAHLLGAPQDLAGRRILEIGAGAGQGTRYLAGMGARAVATDLSCGMLAAGRDLAGPAPPALACDARALPFADSCFDAVVTSYGALPFVADADAVLAEAARVLVPGGRLAASVPHPVRWAFPDVPGEAGLTVSSSYFDRTPYVERAADGALVYAEFHRTVGDWVRLVRDAGLLVADLVEPEWADPAARDWGGWSRRRGELIPGTLVIVADRPAGRRQWAAANQFGPVPTETSSGTESS